MPLFLFQFKYRPFPFKSYGDEYCKESEPSKKYDLNLCLDRCMAEQTLRLCGCKDVSEPGIYMHSSNNDDMTLFMPPDRMIGGILFLSCLFVCLCLSVCLFVCLLSTLTFAINFEPLEVETSYLACILHALSNDT